MPVVDRDRLLRLLHELSCLGATADGGVSRIAFSAADVEARRVVAARMVESGLRIRGDAIGNTIGRLEGSQSGSPAIVVGSHADTVPNGGRFDGVLGVIAAIECARTLSKAGTLRYPLDVVNFVNEENGVMGSRAWAGKVSPEEVAPPEIRSAIRELGGDADRVTEARREPSSIRAYVELHIEQGAQLERQKAPIGVVTSIVGMKRLEVTLTGEAAHAGAKPMSERRDALLAAAKLTVAVNEVAHSISGHRVATVGRMNVSPNASNVIAGQVELTIDLRDTEPSTIEEMDARIRKAAEKIEKETGASISFVERDFLPPLKSEAILLDCIERSAEALGLKSLRMVSRAGHDASIIGQFAPAAMIFVPSKDGISHSPKEHTTDEDCVNGANVLLGTIVELNRT